MDTYSACGGGDGHCKRRKKQKGTESTKRNLYLEGEGGVNLLETLNIPGIGPDSCVMTSESNPDADRLIETRRFISRLVVQRKGRNPMLNLWVFRTRECLDFRVGGVLSIRVSTGTGIETFKAPLGRLRLSYESYCNEWKGGVKVYIEIVENENLKNESTTQNP